MTKQHKSYMFRARLAALEAVFPRRWWVLWYSWPRINLYYRMEQAYTWGGFFAPLLEAGVDPVARMRDDLRRLGNW